MADMYAYHAWSFLVREPGFCAVHVVHAHDVMMARQCLKEIPLICGIEHA